MGTSTLQQVSEMEAFVDLKVASGDLLEGPGMPTLGWFGGQCRHIFHTWSVWGCY